MPPSNLLRLHHLRCLSTTAAAPIAEAAAAASNNPPITITNLRAEYDPDKALEIYSSLSKTLTSRNALELTVRRLAKSKRYDDIVSLIQSHKQDPKFKTEYFLSAFIKCYGVASMPVHALNTYNQIDELGIPRTVNSFNAVLNALVQSKCSEKVPTLFNELSGKYDIVPDKVSYGILVRSYCELGLPEKGLEVLELMKAKNVEVTPVTYSTVMNILYKKGKDDEAERLWTEMLEKGCKLDVAAYNVRLINAGKDIGRVKELIGEMGNFGLKPDIFSYNAVIHCYGKNVNFEEIKKVYQGLEANGCKPNVRTFGTIIYHLCKNAEYEDAYKMFKESVRVNKVPLFEILKPLAVGLAEKKKLSEAKEFFRTLEEKFHPNLMNEWKKVEIDLGLVSEDGATLS
ncbi:hypothetical protein ACFE04_001289 [Oxalis oulophora]